MKAMVLKGPNTPFELRDVPDPVAGPGEAVARVLACGAGLTIQHIKAGRIAADFPRIIGHEITGEIVEAGAGVRGLAVGDAVTAYFYLNCGHCRWCLANLEPLCENSGGNVGKNCDGGYAQYIKLPAHIFIKLPAGLDYKAHPAEIGVITDALATPYKVLNRARVKAGADAVIDASACDPATALRDLTHGQGVDVAIDYVSATETLEAGVKALGRRGRLVTLGGAGKTFQASSLEIMLGEQDLLGSRYVSRTDILDTLNIVARGEVWPLVSDVRPLAQAEALHERLERGEIIGRAALLVG